jgi:uncharacterized phage-like protein YoqJ
MNKGVAMKKTTACFTGPRPEKLMTHWNENSPEIQRIKHQLFATITELVTQKGYRLFLCGMARGIDLIAAETVLSVKTILPDSALAAVIPYWEQRFHQPEPWRERYQAVLQQCDQVLVLHQTYVPGCLIERNHYMVDNSSHLIAVYNGNPNGGTASTIRYAEKKGIDRTIIYTPLTVLAESEPCNRSF